MNDKIINDLFAQHILDVEARRDHNGNLSVYMLPRGDGGGTFEVAGINDRYHSKMANHLRTLITLGQFKYAEDQAKAYLIQYTGSVNEWHPDEVIEGYLRSCAFNRGPGGAAWMLQYALKYAFYPSLYKSDIDRIVGPKTRAASAKADAATLLPAIYGARIVYERTAIPGLKGSRKESSRFWHGLYRRFTEDLQFAYKIAILKRNSKLT